MRYDVVIIGGGLAGMTAGVELQKAGRKCIAVAGGGSLHKTPIAEFSALGGCLLRGDFAVGGEWVDDRLKCIYTRNLGMTTLEADIFILATGKFFSRGLVSTMAGITEPVFGCDVEYDHDRSRWIDEDFFKPQPFESFGVVTDGYGRVMIEGSPALNLYAVGELVAGKHDVQDIIESTLQVCRRII